MEGLHGLRQDPKILKLLKEIEIKKAAQFISLAKKGQPEMSLTPWPAAEQAIFLKWYYTQYL